MDRKSLLFTAETEPPEPTPANPNPEGEKILVFYSEEANVGVKTMRSFIGALDQAGINRGIIIWSEKMTPAARKVIEAMRAQFILEDFDEASLLVNITHHTLVPKHEVMTPQEKRELLQRYRLKDNQLPRIQPTDPVARYLGLSRGQVVRITRRELTREGCSDKVSPASDTFLFSPQLPKQVAGIAVTGSATDAPSLLRKAADLYLYLPQPILLDKIALLLTLFSSRDDAIAAKGILTDMPIKNIRSP